MKLNFFVNVYDDFDDKTRKAIEAHFGLDRLFNQEELEEFAKKSKENLERVKQQNQEYLDAYAKASGK